MGNSAEKEQGGSRRVFHFFEIEIMGGSDNAHECPYR